MEKLSKALFGEKPESYFFTMKLKKYFPQLNDKTKIMKRPDEEREIRIGYVAIVYNKNFHGYLIGSLKVEVKYRGLGIARRLLSKAIEAGKPYDIYIICRPGDKMTDYRRLLQFYESMGFKIIEQRKYPLMKYDFELPASVGILWKC